MPQAVSILFGALFTAAVSMALGKLLLRAVRAPLARQEEHALGFVCGAALLSLLVFLLAAAGLVYKAVFLVLGAVILAIGWRRGVHRPLADSLPPLEGFWKKLFAAGVAVYTVFYFFHAMAPEVSPDGSAYHLGLVSRYLREHGFRRLTTNMYSNLSQGVEMLYLHAFAFGRHSTAALVHFSFLFTLPFAMTFYARRFGIAAAGVCGALLVYASPVVGIDGSSAYNDVAVAAIAFTLFYLLQVWESSRAPGLLVPIGLVAGFLYAAKYTAALGIPYAVGFVIWKSRRKGAPVLAPAAVVSLCALALVLPWVAKNWLWLGNPFSPFFNSLFPNPYVTVGFEKEYAAYHRLYEMASRWEIPMAVTVRGTLAGLLGPVFLLAPLALLSLRVRAGRQLLLAAVVFGATYFANIGTRFLIPCLPFVALALAVTLARARPLAAAVAAAHLVLSWPAIVPRYTDPNTWRITKVPYREALRIKPEEGFLISNLPTYPTARLIERLVPPGAKVLTHTDVPIAYTGRDVLVVYQAAFNKIAGAVLWTPLVEDYYPTWHRRFRFPAQRLRRVRVVQTARGEPDYWNVTELRVSHAGAELARDPRWRLRAHPFPWSVQSAFDNSPVTQWSSEQTLFPGMFLEVDFGRAEMADTVLLECSHGQYKAVVKLEGQDESGQWRELSAQSEDYDVSAPPGMRRMAIEELKRMGISYILVYDFDFKAEDYRGRVEQWGIKLVGEAAKGRLYKLI